MSGGREIAKGRWNGEGRQESGGRGGGRHRGTGRGRGRGGRKIGDEGGEEVIHAGEMGDWEGVDGIDKQEGVRNKFMGRIGEIGMNRRGNALGTTL